MALTLSWYDPAQTVILVQFHDGWTWDDVLSALYDVKRMMISVPQHMSLTLLADLSLTTTRPSQTDQYLARVLEEIPLRVRSVVTVSGDAWVQQMHGTVIEVYDNLKDDWPLFGTIQEAEAYLQRRLPSPQLQ